jgi:multiple sugar transport system substrate-binding protein
MASGKNPLLILAIAFCFIGCAPETDHRTEIIFWGLGAEGENVRALIPEFERTHPSIRVRIQQIPWTAAHEKLLTAYAGRSTPDVAQIGNTWIPEFVLLQAIDTLDRMVHSSLQIDRNDYFPGILSTNIIDSSLYGIPWYVDTRLLFCRKDVLKKYGYPKGPVTWNDLKILSQRIVRGERKGNFAILLPTNEWVPAVIFGLQNSSSLLGDENTRGAFHSPEFLSAFEYMVSFYREKLAPPGISLVTNVYQGFSDGLFAMYITGPWNVGEFKKRLPESIYEQLITVPLPAPDIHFPGISLAGGCSLVVFRTSEHKEEAWQFIEYLSLRETQLKFYSMTGNLPAVRSTWSDSSIRGNPHMTAFYTQLEHVVPTPKIPEWEQIAMKVQEYAEVAAIGTMTVDQTTRALDTEVDRILEKRRWIKTRTQGQ